MRKFYLHTYDGSKTFDLNGKNALAAEPKGLGNAFALSYKDSDKGKHLVNVTPSFENIELQIYFNADGSDGYLNYKSLLNFLAACGTSLFLFEYDDGVTEKYCDVVLKSNSKTEITDEGVFVEPFVFERQTYWYEKVEESFALKNTDAGQTKFPLGFPFGFAGHVFKKKQRISNPFFVDAPITITITGDIENDIDIYIETLDGHRVAEIALATNNAEGTTIIIEPTTKKITVTTDGISTNGYGLTDKTKQSFLYLPQGEYYIGSNMEDTDAGAISLAVKRYLFD